MIIRLTLGKKGWAAALYLLGCLFIDYCIFRFIRQHDQLRSKVPFKYMRLCRLANLHESTRVTDIMNDNLV